MFISFIVKLHFSSDLIFLFYMYSSEATLSKMSRVFLEDDLMKRFYTQMNR